MLGRIGLLVLGIVAAGPAVGDRGPDRAASESSRKAARPARWRARAGRWLRATIGRATPPARSALRATSRSCSATSTPTRRSRLTPSRSACPCWGARERTPRRTPATSRATARPSTSGSINDHAERLTPRQWSETVSAIRQCNAVSGGTPGHRRVPRLGVDPGRHRAREPLRAQERGAAPHRRWRHVPARPIGARRAARGRPRRIGRMGTLARGAAALSDGRALPRPWAAYQTEAERSPTGVNPTST